MIRCDTCPHSAWIYNECEGLHKACGLMGDKPMIRKMREHPPWCPKKAKEKTADAGTSTISK